MKPKLMLLGLSIALALLLATLLPAASTLAAPARGPRIDRSEARIPPSAWTSSCPPGWAGLYPRRRLQPGRPVLVMWRCEEEAPGGAWVLCGQFYDEQGEPQGETMLIGDLVSKFTPSGVAYSPACDCYLAVWTDTFAVLKFTARFQLGRQYHHRRPAHLRACP